MRLAHLPYNYWGAERASREEPYRADRLERYAEGPLRGNGSTYFNPYEGAYLSDDILAETYVTFVDSSSCFYLAGRSDDHCKPPYVRIRDVSERTEGWYWYWFKNNDPMTYELILYSKS